MKQKLFRQVRCACWLLLFGIAGVLSAQTTTPGQQPLNPNPADTGLRSGPMAGYAELTEAALWVQATRPAQVQFRYWIQGQPGSAALSPAVMTSAPGDHIAQVILSLLEPGTRYEYELYIDGRLVPRPYRLSFQTQTFWQWRSDPPAFSVLFGSCAYVNQESHDRPGKPYGSDYDIFPVMAAKQPDLMLWLGDNFYYREPDFFSVAQMKARYAHARALPELQALLAATQHYAIWDDHDYGPNDADWTYRMKQPALEIFKAYWPNPAFGHDGVPGVYFSFSWNDIDFFMLDNRYHRSPNFSRDSLDKVMFGPAQMRWLKDGLIASRAPFKIIVSGNQMLNPMSPGESFAKFPHEYRQFLQWLQEQDVWGVVFLSGDRHMSELIRLQPEGFYPLYDFTSSSLTAGTYRAEKDLNNPYRVPGTLYDAGHGFGMLRFEGPRRDRKLTMECYDKSGKLVWRQAVKASELRPKREAEGQN